MRNLICADLLAASLAAMAIASGEKPEPRDNTLHCNGLSVKDHENASRIHALAEKDISGVWVTHPSVKSQAAIYTSRTQGSVIGLYGDTSKDTAMTFAIAIQGGEAYFQIRDKAGEIHQVPASDLLKLASINPAK
jgi:hypothetical protein